MAPCELPRVGYRPSGGSSAPGSAGATPPARVLGLRHSLPAIQAANQESSTHIPVRSGEITAPQG